MPHRYAAFVSYAHRYKDWVAELQRNLEASLRAAGAEPAEVFLDQTDLGSGRSWIAQLQEGLTRSDHLVLVATPEGRGSFPSCRRGSPSRFRPPSRCRRPSSEFVELELLEFDEGQRRQFLEQWFGRTEAPAAATQTDKLMQALADDTSLWDLAGNPLYLTLIALLFERGQSPARNRSQLYDQVFQLLLEGRHRPAAEGIACREAVRVLLRRLACDMTHEDLDAEPKSKIEARLYQDAYDELRKPLEKLPEWRRSLDPFLDDLAEKTGILGPHDGPVADWRYWHRTFREALTAEQLAEDLEAGGEERILARAKEVEGDEGRWAEPFALLVGCVEDPDRLVTSLAEANRGLGLRAVATAQRLRDETVQGVLQLTDGWQERLYDVHGNVWEWTSTALDSLGAYEGRENGIDIDPSANPAAASRGDRRVIRGGGFSFTADGSRAAYRVRWNPRFEIGLQGFRVVRRPPPSGDR